MKKSLTIVTKNVAAALNTLSRRHVLKTITDIKKSLMDEIQNLALQKDKYVRNPGVDYSRSRKITFADAISSMISMEAGSIRSELLEYFSYAAATPTTSAFIQQRDKISPLAFEKLFYSFTDRVSTDSDSRDYNYYAVDGSKINIPVVPDSDEDYTYFSREDQREYCQIHLDAIFDLKNKIYKGASYCPRKQNNERAAFHSMLDELSFPQKSVFIFDRGYEGYALMAHISSKNQYFVIRAKDRKNGGIIKGISIPQTEEYDFTYDKIFVHRMKAAYRKHPEKYHVVHKTFSPYFLNKETKEYPLAFRLVRFKLDNESYECLLTNLPQEQFNLNALKEIYHMRWGIETSFRQLKHTVGLVDFHSKKIQSIKQEIWTRLIMFNFCSAIEKTVQHKEKTAKYKWMLNFSNLVLICRRILLAEYNALSEFEELISKVVSPIRPGRSNPRNKRRQRSPSFNYRKR